MYLALDSYSQLLLVVVRSMDPLDSCYLRAIQHPQQRIVEMFPQKEEVIQFACR